METKPANQASHRLLRILLGAGVVVVLVVCGVLAGFWHRATGPRMSGPLRHQAYVWQRTWDGRVQAALSQHGTNFDRLILLAAEVAWVDGRARTVQAALDYPALRAGGRPVGLALRIGAFAGPFATNDPTAVGLASLAAALVKDARTNGVAVSELHVDFDCAESNLAGYRRWLSAIRAGLESGLGTSPSSTGGVALTITTLPSWLKRREFAELVRATDGYVLQVHSLARPRTVSETFSLCDPKMARRWVEQAEHVGVPFQVALPTYGYRLAFDGAGRFLGLNAEGPEKFFSGAMIRREVRADPVAMAELVRQWGNDRPTGMVSVIWYRLPVSGDSLNWSWPMMSEVMAGRAPSSSVAVQRRVSRPGLVELSLTNAGQGDYIGKPVVRVRWAGGRLVGGDGLREFVARGPGDGLGAEAMEFGAERSIRLAAGEERSVGWVRLEGAGEVVTEFRSDDEHAKRTN